MRFLTLLLAILSSAMLCAQGNEPYCSKYKGSLEGKRLVIDDHRSDSVDILHTVIDLDITSLSSEQISGVSTLIVQGKLPDVEEIRLDLEGLTVDSVFADGLASFQQGAADLNLSFNDPLSTSQSIEVTIYYHGAPMKDASGWGGFYFTSQFAWNLGVGFADDPHSYGRVWFPCFDNFIERSTYEFHIRTSDNRLATCNGLLQDSINNNDGTKTYSWSMTDPIPSYLVNVSVGPYVMVESLFEGIAGNVPVQLFVRASDTGGLANSFIHLHDAVAAFEAAYGEYKFQKVGYSMVPFNGGAMEHATNISYPLSAVNGGLGSESLMTHELAHMWWGDNVTCQTDGDMWLNEGWASFSEYLFDEAVYDRETYVSHMLEDLRYMLQFGHHYEEGYRAVSGQPHEYVYGDHVYKKGALVAHNLRGYLEDETFFSTIDKFMDEYQFMAISSDTLERFFSQETGKDLSYFFRDWVFNPGWNVTVLDSFRSTPDATGYEVELYVQQKLKGTAQYHDEVPLYYTIYDAQWNSVKGQGVISGEFDQVIAQSPIEPVFVVLNEDYHLAQALTADQFVISSTAGRNLKNMYWDIDVNEVSDSALVRFEQVWSYPDPIKDYNNKAFRMNDNRYWRVSGIGVEGIDMEARFFYDGRDGGSSGYMDVSLLTETEDSLILLYRSSSASDWDEYEHYEKDVLGVSDNAFGLIHMDKILPGEYVLANRDTSVLGMGEIRASDVFLYPNPTAGQVYLKDPEQRVEQVRIYSLDGKLVRKWDVENGRSSIDTSELSKSIHTYELIGEHSAVIATGRLVLQ